MSEAAGPAANNKNSRERASPWPEISEGAVAFLLDVRDSFEASLLRDWVSAEKPDDDACPPHFFVELPRGRSNGLNEALANAGESLWLQPLRIAWLPAAKAGGRRSLTDFFQGRVDEPGRLRRRWIAERQPERLARVAGDGAWLDALRERRPGPAGSEARFAEYVVSQALIALERAERSLRGARYKVSRILPGDVFANDEFRNLLANIAQQRDRPLEDVRNQAARYLREMAATQTPVTIDLMTALYRSACRSHHDAEINVDDAQIERVSDAVATRPVVFLISHKSMLDTAALSLVLFDANLPLPLTFGGINLNTPGMGALARRAGIIFLRRSFQDNEIYKATFRRYIDYLIEKRFSLLWALEGTRSRTGKLLPPRFGLFNYVFEAIQRTGLYDLTFIPVSVAYDQITEVEDYSIEQRGQKKKPEGLTWPLRFLRRGRSRGQIHLRLGEGLTIRDLVDPAELDAGIDNERKQVLVPTLAFEVAVRMNAATPITATAIITLILLAGGNRAQSLAQIQGLARAGAALVRRRDLEIVGRADFRDPEAVLATLGELKETGIVSYLDEGTERLYTISPDQHLNAAYYRNTAIHYFILDAFVEVALLDAAASDDPVEAFFDRANELRELFKFEFYFPRRADYRPAIESRVLDRFPEWEDTVTGGPASVTEALNRVQPLVAHAVLRSFADAYRVAVGVLSDLGDEPVGDRSGLLSQCLKSGRQQHLQGRVFSAESISKSLYEAALKLAEYRGLLAGKEGEARRELERELRGINSRLDEILAVTLAKAEDD